jgi:hypothetical protein
VKIPGASFMPFSPMVPHTCCEQVPTHHGRAVRERRRLLVTTHRTLQQFREDIQQNKVAFPTPVPVFHGEGAGGIQWRAAELYLVHGWTCSRLGQRYGLTRGRIWQLVRSWIDKAQTRGYLQDIPPALPVIRLIATAEPVAFAEAMLPLPIPPEWASQKPQHTA